MFVGDENAHNRQTSSYCHQRTSRFTDVQHLGCKICHQNRYKLLHFRCKQLTQIQFLYQHHLCSVSTQHLMQFPNFASSENYWFGFTFVIKVVQTKVIFFLNQWRKGSDPTYNDSKIEVVLSCIRLFPTLIPKIKWRKLWNAGIKNVINIEFHIIWTIYYIVRSSETHMCGTSCFRKRETWVQNQWVVLI